MLAVQALYTLLLATAAVAAPFASTDLARTDAPPSLLRRNGPKPGTEWYGLLNNQWDDAHQNVVLRAWDGAMNMAKAASTSLLDMSAEGQLWMELDEACKGRKGTPSGWNCLRMYYAKENPAYHQMFGADPENIQMIASNFEKIHKTIENIDADGRNRLPLLLSMSHAGTKNGKDQCADGTYAWTDEALAIDEIRNLPGQRPAPGQWIINFCPVFFDKSKVGRFEEQLELLAQGHDKHDLCNLDKLDSTTRLLLHEWTHIPWILDTNADREEMYGYRGCSSIAVNQKNDQQLCTLTDSSQNADSYAWMGVYNFFNNLQECQGVQYEGVNKVPLDQACTDVWPSDQPKIIRPKWAGYPSSEMCP